MSHFEGQIRSIYDGSNISPRDKDDNHFPQYHVVAVHGLGQIGHHDTAWTDVKASGEQACWLSDFLPMYSNCVRVTRYDFSCDSLGNGISVGDVKHLAKMLLDGLLKDVAHNALDRLVFIGQDLGGLVVKQALLMALTMHQYHHIAAMTSFLVFFATPHRVRSSESMASWMLFLAGEDRGYKVSWFSQTAHMIETVNAAFDPFKLVYKTMSIFNTHSTPERGDGGKLEGLDESSATMGFLTERTTCRTEPHSMISIFSSAVDPTFEAICQELNRSRNPGLAFIECLDYLMELFRAEEMQSHRHSIFTDNSASRQALDQLQQNRMYQEWSKAQSGPLFVKSNIAIDDAIHLLQTGQTTIGGTLRLRGHAMLETQLPAYLSYQLLCQEPALFQHIQRLVEHIRAEIGPWPEKVWILLRSLLSCPAEPVRVCCIQQATGRITSDGYSSLRRLIMLSEDRALPLKLLMITSSAHQEMGQLGSPANSLVEVGQALENFQTILQDELNMLIPLRPELGKIRDIVEFVLHLCYDRRRQAFHEEQPETSMLDLVQSWIAFLVLDSSPATTLSIKASAYKIPENLHDMYTNIVDKTKVCTGGPEALRALLWSSRAFRPLSVHELSIAAALDLGATKMTDVVDQIPLNLSLSINTIFSPIAYIANDEPMTVSDSFAGFISGHNHAQCSTKCLFRENDHATIALKCLHYIRLVDDAGYFRSQLQTRDNEADRLWSLLHYAVIYWAEHYKLAKKEAVGESGDGNADTLSEFKCYFNDRALIRKWAHLFCAIPHPLKAVVWVDPTLVAVEIGCFDLVKEMLKSPDAMNPGVLNTALEIAIGNGDEDLVGLLSRSGAVSLNALHLAALSGKATMRLLRRVWDASGWEDEAQTPIHFACKSGSLETVSELLVYTENINARSRESGSTPLHLACQYGHHQVITLLLKNGASANVADEAGMTPLHAASFWQQPLAIRALLEHSLSATTSIDLLAADENGATVIHTMANTGRLDILKLIIGYLGDKKLKDNDKHDSTILQLLHSRDDGGSTPLHKAAAQGHAAIAQEIRLLEKQYSCSLILVADNNGDIPLHLAVRSGHLDVVDLLLGEQELVKYQLEQEGSRGACAIHLAVIHGHVDLVQRLCHSHQSEEVSLSIFYGDESQSPLHLAVNNRQVQIVQLLLDAEATPDIMDASEATPLLYACRKGFTHIVELLLRHTTRTDTPDKHGVSPLLAAAENNNAKVIRMLLDVGVNTEIVDLHGQNALHRAAYYGSAKALEFLLGYACMHPSSRDNEGNTPLHLAMRSRSAHPIPAIRALLQSGASPELKNLAEIMPLAMAETAEVAIALADAVDFSASDASRVVQREFLQLSATKGHLEVIKDQHRRYPATDLSVRNDQGQSLYHIATKSGNLEIVEYLIANSVSGYDGPDTEGCNPAWYAAKYGYFSIFKAIAGVAPGSLNQPDEERRTPLCLAVKQGHYDIVRYLLTNREKFSIEWEQGDDETKVNRDLYHLAANKSDESLEMIQLLMDHGVPGLEWEDGHHRAPVAYAAMEGHLEIVKVLRQHAFGSFNQIDKDGKTPLYHAVERRHKDLVEYFIAQGVALDLAEFQLGWTALHLAVSSGQEDMVDILMGASASRDGQDKQNRTPLFLAAYDGWENIVELLLKWGCNVSLRDEKGWTPLIAAYDNCRILDLLVKAGASIDAKAIDGLTALHGAASVSETSVSFLLSKGADVMDPDSEGWTSFHYASNASDSGIIRLLLEKVKGTGISPDTINDKGHTPLMTAFDFGALTAAQELLQSGHFDINHVDPKNPSIPSIATLATQRGRPGVECLLDYGGSSLNQPQLEQLLAWATEEKTRGIQSKCMDLLLMDKTAPLKLSSADKLFEIAADHDDKPLVQFLCECDPAGLEPKRDKYNWTLNQISTSYRRPSSNGQTTFDIKQTRPTGWDREHTPRILILDEDGMTLHRNEPGEHEITAVRANSPVRLMEKFYFEVEIIACKTDCLGIGFGYQKCELHRMPGWDDNTWGLHADDGGLFHGYGWPREADDDWTYTTGDVIGCCIDSAQRKATFTKNGIGLGTCFTGITGRVFPMVALGVGDMVVGNFGNVKDAPFRYPDGRNWVHTSEEVIEQVDRSSRDKDEE